MNPPSPLVKVSMIREHLDGIPQFPLPPGFSIRSYHPGDALAWTQIWGEADQFQAAPAGFFEHQFGSDEARLRERQLFLCYSQV